MARREIEANIYISGARNQSLEIRSVETLMVPLRSIISVFCVSGLGFSALPAGAGIIFAEKRVLPYDKTVDVTVWLADTASNPSDSAWICGSEAGSLKLASCQVRPYVRTSGNRDQYLYWAFLNLSEGSERGDLAPQLDEYQSFFDALQKPLLALKQKGGSCQYLLSFRDSYAPLAAGTVACPDLATALKGVDADLSAKPPLIARTGPDPIGKKVLRRGEFAVGSARAIDWGLEFVPALAFGWSSDETDGEGPFATRTERFDFNDFADQEMFPLAVRATMMFRGAVGLRLGYAYSSFSLSDDFMEALRSGFATEGNVLSAWDISRKDISCELVAGVPFTGASAEYALYGSLGFANVDFRETQTVNGKEYQEDLLLKDASAFLIGFGADMKLARCVVIGLELGVMAKDFKMRSVQNQPDGSGNEIQIRFRLGGFYRRHLSGPEKPMPRG